MTIAIDAFVIGTIFTDWGGIAEGTTTAAIGGTLYNLGTLSATLGGDPIFYTSRVQFARLTGQDGFTQVIATVPNYSATWRS